MTLYASKFSEHIVVVQSDVTSYVMTTNGYRDVLSAPLLVANFKPGRSLPAATLLACMNGLLGRDRNDMRGVPTMGTSFGALAGNEDDTIDGVPTVAFDPRFRIGFFETDEVEQEHRATYERVLDLLASAPTSNGIYKFVAERTPAPWPAYDKLVTKAGVSKADVVRKIVAKIEDDGYNPIQVIAYERENLNREDVVRGIEEHVALEIAQRAEDAALEVTV
jgi:hypothetical protein